MEVETLALPKKKAEEEFQALRQAFKQNAKLRRDEIRTDLQRVYKFMRHGGKLIDLQESFRKAGLTEDDYPRLAICRADSKTVCCEMNQNSPTIFYHDKGGKRNFNGWRTWNSMRGGDVDDIKLPQEVFSFEHRWYHERIQAPVPVIPAKILVNEVKVLLKNFHILWEVEEWKPIPPKDPILLKRLTPNLYGILATWNLTKLERAIIRGRI